MEKKEGKRRDDQPARKRKPYHPPHVDTEQVFETLAFACGKIQANQSGCMIITKNS
ncbi:MAG TPA: hypothetical protein VGL91_13135 [Acidobacteriota bacterium]|jgi:hypothetical protein